MSSFVANGLEQLRFDVYFYGECWGGSFYTSRESLPLLVMHRLIGRGNRFQLPLPPGLHVDARWNAWARALLQRVLRRAAPSPGENLISISIWRDWICLFCVRASSLLYSLSVLPLLGEGAARAWVICACASVLLPSHHLFTTRSQPLFGHLLMPSFVVGINLHFFHLRVSIFFRCRMPMNVGILCKFWWLPPRSSARQCKNRCNVKSSISFHPIKF